LSKAGPLRILFFTAGILCTALGAVGAFLPVLPTTPFLLLAAACFARSSETLHQRLLANRMFGPYIKRWEEERTIPRAVKRKAIGLVAVSFAISIYIFDEIWMRVMHACLGVAVIAFIACLPTSKEDGEAEE